MPRYFMGDTRLAGLERMMMDPSRPAPSRIGPRRQSDDAQRIQAEGRPLKVRGTAACGSTRAREEPVQRTSAERRRPKEELGKVVNDLRRGVLKDLPSMRRYCYNGRDGALGAPAGAQRSGSGGERRKERSGVEFSPSGGNETGGVSSDEGGSCCQNYGFTLETERYLYRLRCNPIEGDYQAYLSCFDKQTQQMALTEQEQPPAEPAPVIGRITYAHDAPEEFTDPEKYLAAIREELPYHSTTGFRCETLTADPEIRKAVDDMLCDFYGEENPRTLADYGGAGMTIGGMGG